MRLLERQANGSLVLRHYANRAPPAYAILSHTWESGEVSLEDIKNHRARAKRGWKKIDFCSRQAHADGLRYIWIDTCCIDRKDAVELQAAINSMFRWYRDSVRCYVYLGDVSAGKHDRGSPLSTRVQAALLASRWFLRGWTLQELIAPRAVEFYSQDEQHLGSRTDLVVTLSNITRIPVDVLLGGPVTKYSIAERESWMTGRRTTRPEDRAYALFGLFNVFMPLIYGEGYDHAYRRLKDEVQRNNPAIPPEDIIEVSRGTTRTAATSTDLVLARSCTQSIQAKAPARPSRLAIAQRQEQSLVSSIVSPQGMFESGKSFLPCQYSCSHLGPQLVCYSLQLIEKTEDTVRLSSKVFLALHQRHWLSLEVEILLTEKSSYRSVLADIAVTETSYTYWRQLPASIKQVLLTRTQYLFSEAHTESETDEHYILTLGCNDETSMAVVPASSVNGRHCSIPRQIYRQGYDDLRHMNVRTFSTNDLAMTSLHGMMFTACVDNRWVFCRPCQTSEKDVVKVWNQLLDLIRLRDVTECVQLVGALVDHRRRIFQGLLVDPPTKGTVFDVLADARERNTFVPWRQREKWARDIVRGVAKMHERGVCVGGFRTFSWGVCIDEDNRAIILGLSLLNHAGVNDFGGLLPPECRTEAFCRDLPPTPPTLDIFQLGHFLWHLYRHEDHQHGRTFCKLSGCANSTRESNWQCCEPHYDPVQLPKAREDMPEYLHEMITACRRADPALRPTARMLLDMFPPEDQVYEDDFVEPQDCCYFHQQQSQAQQQQQQGQDHFGSTSPTSPVCPASPTMGPKHLRTSSTSTTTSTSPPTSPTILATPRFSRVEHVFAAYRSSGVCSLCSTRIRATSYRCETCDRGSYDLCGGCFARGEHCHRDAHWLVQNPYKSAGGGGEGGGGGQGGGESGGGGDGGEQKLIAFSCAEGRERRAMFI